MNASAQPTYVLTAFQKRCRLNQYENCPGIRAFLADFFSSTGWLDSSNNCR